LGSYAFDSDLARFDIDDLGVIHGTVLDYRRFTVDLRRQHLMPILRPEL
jgi:hypothetical protein